MVEVKDEWFYSQSGSFADIENHYIIDSLMMLELSILNYYFSEYDEILINLSFHTLLNDKSSIYEKIRVYY